MTPEDEEFERIAREIRRNAVEDDDIQDYKKPWVGLTNEEIYEAVKDREGSSWRVIVDAIEQRLKEKNF